MEEESHDNADQSERLAKLKASRRAKMGVLTRKKNETMALMNDAQNVETVQLKMGTEFDKTYNDLHEVNESIKMLLSPNNAEIDQNEWFLPKMTVINEFKNYAEKWLLQIKMTDEEAEGAENEIANTGDAPVTVDAPVTADIAAGLDDIGPKDSISQVKSKHSWLSRSSKHYSRSSRSSTSSKSSIASLKVQLESEQVELVVKAEALQQKQALERREAALKAEKEEFELKTKMAVNTAKLNLVKGYEMQHVVPERMNQNENIETGLSHQATGTVNSDHHTFDEDAEQLTPVFTQLPLTMERNVTCNFQPATSKQRKPAIPAKDLSVRSKILPFQTHYAPLDPNYVAPASLPPVGGSREQKNVASHQNPKPSTSQALPNIQHAYATRGADARKAADHLTLPQDKQYQQLPVLQNTTKRNEFDDVMTLMEKQNKITETFITQQGQHSLPSVVIPVFKGDPLDYQFFIRAFDYGIENKTKNNQDRLYFLEQFTAGQPRELVRSCQFMDPERGYAKAKELLKRHFGDEHNIATSYLNKVLKWPLIRSEDAEALQTYSVFLNGCLSAMSSVQYLEELDHPTNLKAILSKLPYKIQERWRVKARLLAYICHLTTL